MRYTIKDLYSTPDVIYYLNEETDGLENLFITSKYKRAEPSPLPKEFDSIQDAKRYLKELKRWTDQDWEENGNEYVFYGRKKHMWDIYEIK